MVEGICSEYQGYVTSGVVKLISVVRLFRALEAFGNFGMPSYFLCALYIHSNNAEASRTFLTLNKMC